MDKDTSDYLKKYMDTSKITDKELLGFTDLLAQRAAGVNSIVADAYSVDDIIGNEVFASIISTILIYNSNTSDQALGRLSEVFTLARRDIIRIDTAVNIEGINGSK